MIYLGLLFTILCISILLVYSFRRQKLVQEHESFIWKMNDAKKKAQDGLENNITTIPRHLDVQLKLDILKNQAIYLGLQ